MLVNSINSTNSGKFPKFTGAETTKGVKFAPSMLACDTFAVKKAPSTIGHSVRSAIAGVCIGLAALLSPTACSVPGGPEPMTAQKVLLNMAKTLDPSAAAKLQRVDAVSFLLDDGGDALPIELKFDYKNDKEVSTHFLTLTQGSGGSVNFDFFGESRLTADDGIIYDSALDPSHDIKFNVVDNAVQVEFIDTATNAVSETLLLTKGAAADTAILKDVAEASKFASISEIAFNDAAKLVPLSWPKALKSIK